MIGSSLTGVLNMKVPAIEHGERLYGSLQSLAATTLSTMAQGGERIAHTLRSVVMPVVEPLPERAVGAIAWINGRVLDGFDLVGTGAAASMSFVDAELCGIRDRTRRVLDQSIDAGLHRLGVPTQKEVTALSHRMDRISATVERLRREVEHKAAPRRPRRPASKA